MKTILVVIKLFLSKVFRYTFDFVLDESIKDIVKILPANLLMFYDLQLI